ncbi:HEAT repeat-containing protein 1 [Sphaeramia orbicularis]|uniref:HEAT repeat-containing protein 1 n=1 Tax=Sphaeramia orbicularis TaxID=375764 RepID=UPI00117CAF9B|nr:HEAT repeat-containing protein 1 [Sphaeramia orbicularis]
MTSLSHQLKRLALPQTDASLLICHDVASLLFDPKDAATMDRSTFYALGCTGLEELLGLDPVFADFQQTLFSPSSQTLERSVQSKEVNRQLDDSISLFLSRLCPYFLLKPAHKCMEWLIHRFHIHLYNVDSLLSCVFPYHDTKVFVRVLQLLRIKDSAHRWNWLQCLQKPGVPLSRAALVVHCTTDLGFMDFICSMVPTSIQAFSAHPGGCSQLRVVFSFYASTIVSALDAVEKVSESIISKLLPYVHKGLKSPLADYKAASYMIVCQLAVSVVLEAGLVDALAFQVVKSVVKEPVLDKEGLGCLMVLLQNQKDGAAGPRVFSRLCSMASLVPTLQLMSSRHDITPLMRHLVPHLVTGVFSGSGDEVSVLESVLSSVPLTKHLDQTLARLLLDQYLSQTPVSDESISSLNQRLLPLIRLFESKYCSALDDVLAGHVTDVDNDEQKRLFHEFLSLSMSSGKYKILGDSDTSVLLSLNHPQPSVRALALEHLMDVVTSGQPHSLEESFLKDSVVERLKDDVPAVVAAALKLLEMLLDVLDPEHTASCLLSLLHRIDLPTSEKWLPVLTEAVRLLSDPQLGKGDVEFEQRIGWKLLPFLVMVGGARDSAQVRFSSCVARTSVVKRHPLTLKWAGELDEVMKKSSDPDFAGLANQRLMSTLTKNLGNMEVFFRQEALETLAHSVELLQGSGLRDRVSFLVLVQTLLQGLDQLTETKHLLTSQRAFGLLEARLVFNGDPDRQEAGRPPSGPSSFSEALSGYLSRCGSGDHLDSDFSWVLLALLRDFIHDLKCHDATFRGETWWNPEKLDANTCCYLNLLCRLFAVIMGGAGEGPASGGFRDLMKVLVQVHLPEPLMLFRFLCLLWGYGGNHGDQLDVKVGAVLQTQALYMGRALLASQNAATLRLLADAHSPVVPSLLVCLCSPVREVRRAGLGVLQSLSAADASPYQPITERLLRNSEEITADPSYLNTALAALHQDSLSSKSQTQQKKLQTSMQQLLEVVRSPNCPSYTAGSLLRAMSHVNGPDVLSALLPVLDRLQDQAGPDVPALLADEARLVQLLLGKFTQESAPLLATDRKCLELFVCALKSSAPSHPSIPSSQIIALEQISKSFFSSVGDESVQQKLLAVMFDLLVDNRSPQVANGVSSAFKGISVDAQLVANELSPPDKPAVGGTVQQSRRSRMTSRKKADGGVAEPEGGAVSWGRVCLILELLQHKKKLKRVQTLVPVLFSLLSRCLESGPADQTSVEYTKQLLLSCLLNVCTKLGPDGPAPDPGVLDEDKFSVELVVQCIRMSEVPQTHHQALLLLGSVAAIFPDKVLLNIMPIFTFMGANIMRLDDAYSFRVIDKTVQMVIPALIQAHQLSDGQTSPHMVAMATRIMHVFADALPHVPEHRRLPILTQLVTTLGPAHFLWALMLLLFKLHATAAHAGDKDAALQKDLDFWICVCGQFEVNEQLTSVVRILGFLLRLPDDKDDAPVKHPLTRTGAKKKEEPEEKGEDLIFNVDAHSSKELRHFKFICVSFMAQLLRSNSFIEKVSDCADVLDECVLQLQLQQRLLEEILRYIHSVARCVEENADKPTAKFWRVLLNKAYEVLDQMNALLPTDTFITVMKGLMGNELPSVRRKAMELLNNKLQHRTRWEEPQVAVFLALIDDLLSVVGKPRSQLTRDGVAEHAVNRQTALYSLKLLCRGFGSAHQEAFAPVLVRAVEIVTATEEDKNVTGSGLLCIAEVVSTLKARAIPQLPRLMPAVLSALRDRKELLTNEIYLLSAVTALQRITETLPHFISPYLQDVTSQVCRLTCLLHSSSSSSSSAAAQLSARLSALRNTLSTKLPPRVLLPTVSRTYSSLVLDRKTQLGALMSILKEHISHMDKDQLSVHQSELTAFFLTALDFRSEHCKDDLDEAERVEGAVIDCLVAMVMKLSEVTFRPLFFKLFDWSKSEVGGADRLLTFYRLTDAVADRLKGLFVLFAGNLVKPFADLLRRSADAGERLFESDPGEHKTCLLLRSVLDAMTKVFMYDTQRFLSAERAHTLMSPLVDQVENLVGGAERYQQRVSQHLVPCVGQFAAALADHAHWKTLNYQVLLKTRHSHAEVRFSALLLLLEVASKLKENYVVLLPETIPFLAELMEDECEQVEQQVQSVVQEMENILGEPLNAYF